MTNKIFPLTSRSTARPEVDASPRTTSPEEHLPTKPAAPAAAPSASALWRLLGVGALSMAFVPAPLWAQDRDALSVARTPGGQRIVIDRSSKFAHVESIVRGFTAAAECLKAGDEAGATRILETLHFELKGPAADLREPVSPETLRRDLVEARDHIYQSGLPVEQRAKLIEVITAGEGLLSVLESEEAIRMASLPRPRVEREPTGENVWLVVAGALSIVVSLILAIKNHKPESE